jgi:MFS family permease
MTAMQVIIVAITIGLTALDGYDVLAISFASPGIAKEWGIDRAALGVVLSMELLGMALGSVLLGGIADRIGRRNTVLTCLVIMSSGMAMVTTVKSIELLCIWRVLTGLGIGGMLAAGNAIATEFSNHRHRDLSVALMAIGYPVGAVLGHSFGGKVALGYLGLPPTALDIVYSVDSSPSPRPPDLRDSPTRDVVALLESLPPRLPSREALVDLAMSRGLGQRLGEWLAMNLEREGEGFRLVLEMPAIRAMLEDYFELDAWPLVDALPGHTRFHAIIGGRSEVWTEADRAHLGAASAAQPGRIVSTTLPTGHWVHVEDADGLVEAIVSTL